MIYEKKIEMFKRKEKKTNLFNVFVFLVIADIQKVKNLVLHSFHDTVSVALKRVLDLNVLVNKTLMV